MLNNVHLKNNVSLNEYAMYKYILELEAFNVPKIIAYDIERKVLVTEKKNDVICDSTEKIREIIINLLRYNIEYSNINQNNFIEYDNKIWIVDFTNVRTIVGRLNKNVSNFIDNV